MKIAVNQWCFWRSAEHGPGGRRGAPKARRLAASYTVARRAALAGRPIGKNPVKLGYYTCSSSHTQLSIIYLWLVKASNLFIQCRPSIHLIPRAAKCAMDFSRFLMPRKKGIMPIRRPADLQIPPFRAERLTPGEAPAGRLVTCPERDSFRACPAWVFSQLLRGLEAVGARPAVVLLICRPAFLQAPRRVRSIWWRPQLASSPKRISGCCHFSGISGRRFQMPSAPRPCPFSHNTSAPTHRPPSDPRWPP